MRFHSFVLGAAAIAGSATAFPGVQSRTGRSVMAERAAGNTTCEFKVQMNPNGFSDSQMNLTNWITMNNDITNAMQNTHQGSVSLDCSGKQPYFGMGYISSNNVSHMPTGLGQDIQVVSTFAAAGSNGLITACAVGFAGHSAWDNSVKAENNGSLCGGTFTIAASNYSGPH